MTSFPWGPISRRSLLASGAAAAAAMAVPRPLRALCQPWPDPDEERLATWVATLRAERLLAEGVPFGRAVIRAGELAVGTPYVAFTLESYLEEGGSPQSEPLILSLTRFDCVTLVEASIAAARVAALSGAPSWERFGREVQRMRYRTGCRTGYDSRLHYFSEWIGDGAARGLVTDLGSDLGGIEDTRPLRFMTAHRTSYRALADDGVFAAIGAMEQRLDPAVRRYVPKDRIPKVLHRIETGDILAFATSIPGLDVTHAAFAYRDAGAVRVLHAPLSGGTVEITRATLPEYVAAIRSCTGILVARPARAAA